MALMAIFSLFCYMTTLAVALTIYGANLMNSPVVCPILRSSNKRVLLGIFETG